MAEEEEAPPEAPAEEEPAPPEEVAGEEAPPLEDTPAFEETTQQPTKAEEATPAPESPNDPSQIALDMEFLYYGSVLKILGPTVSLDADKERANPWIKKLFRPEYQTSKLRDKRNRYLVCLTICLLNDEIDGIFKEKPPEKSLAEINTIYVEPSPAAEWETSRMWQDVLLGLPDDFQMMPCAVHSSQAECDENRNIDKVLDQEFQFLLYVARPYAALLAPEDKTRTAAWLQTLCTVHGKVCGSMKGIRNDYLMALMGYLMDLRVAGPFVEYPPSQLEPLKDAAEKAAKHNHITDPTSHDASMFLLDQPVPEDGAFCYVALTGDLIASGM